MVLSFAVPQVEAGNAISFALSQLAPDELTALREVMAGQQDSMPVLKSHCCQVKALMFIGLLSVALACDLPMTAITIDSIWSRYTNHLLFDKMPG